MIYYLISPNYINVVTFASIIFAFAITCLAIYMGKNILPRDGGRATQLMARSQSASQEEQELYLSSYLQ